MDNLEETDKFLEKFKLPRLTLEEREIMNKPTTSTEIKLWLKKKKFPKNESPGPDGFKGEFFHTFREKLISIFLKLLQKFSEEETLLNLFCEATISLTKPERDNIQKRKLQANITDEYRCKNPQQNSSKQNSTTN